MEAILSALVGILAGFMLNTLWKSYKDRKNREEKIEQIKEELRSNYHAIHQKKDHINKIIENLNSNKILPGISVKFITTYYSTYLNELYPYLSALERNSLHVIYQYFELTDRLMNNFESNILKFLSLEIMKNDDEVYPIFSRRFGELLQMLEKTKGLVENYLKGHPIDVFYINKENKPDSLI